MNKARREDIQKAIDLMFEARMIIGWCKDDEEDAFDNLPESIQMSERGEQMESNVEAMDECIDYLESVEDALSEIIG